MKQSAGEGESHNDGCDDGGNDGWVVLLPVFFFRFFTQTVIIMSSFIIVSNVLDVGSPLSFSLPILH